MINRRSFLQGLAGGAAASSSLARHRRCFSADTVLQDSQDTVSDDTGDAAPAIDRPLATENVFSFIRRQRGTHDLRLYAQILGAANEFKEGDKIVGVAAANDTS
ncbi:MAG: hypothetical protein QGG09_08665, partial [Pirellulaceae bacterium]|nr:hypothetical protein [Pirellulaceae bacterium]